MSDYDDDEHSRRMAQRIEDMKRISRKSRDAESKGPSTRASKASAVIGRKRSVSVENITKIVERQVQKMSEGNIKRKLSDSSRSTEETFQRQNTVRISERENDEIGSKGGRSGGTVSDTDSVTISELNFRISDTEFSHLLSHTKLRNAFSNLHGKADYMPLSEFEKVVKKLYKCCLKSVTDLHELHLRRMLALPIINDIIVRADPEYISTTHIIHMVWSVMSCLHHFQLRLKSGSNRLVMYTRQRMVDKCMDYYLQLIRMFKPKMHRIILSAIITFYKDGKLWDVEFACTDMIVALLNIYTDVEDGVNDLLNSAISSAAVNTLEAQKLMQVIYEVLRSVKWNRITRKLIDKLLLMLESSISPKDEDEELYMPLRMGIDLCIRYIINNISNNNVMVILKRLLKKMVSNDVTEEMMLNFGNLASYTAKKYTMKSFYVNITPDLLYYIRVLAHEENQITFLTAMRIWLNLIDRNENSAKVNEPKIFFRGCDYKIVTKKKCNIRDKMFFKSNRNYFYELITDCFKECTSRVQMNALFEVCAVTLVEIPCGYTAATFTSIAMSMQEFALKTTMESLVKSHYLHATALSILSLICYLHKAEVFYEYVTNIVDRRAEWAPHLIPPLRSQYEYALHHIIWNKPELFFEDWEARYGLWKCFRIRKKKNK